MNRLSPEKRKQIVACLVEGSSIRATARMTGVSKNTVVKLLTDLGLVCSIYQDRMLRDLPCERIQCDEIWAFVYAKQKNVKRIAPEKRGQAGDVWTWVALDEKTKLVPTYRIGSRDVATAIDFMQDLKKRLRHRVQLTTDGHFAYVQAVKRTFGDDVDYAMLVKLYGSDADARVPERRYSPSVCIGADIVPMQGEPDPAHISTSHIERLNLTMRMSMRRYTRLTNAFSKKAENLAAAVSIHFMHYNFCRVHQTLGKTPAMAAGVADHVWTLDELVALLTNAEQAVPMKRGPYKKRAAS
jgi:IS1 family transposase